jgi:hypothetical protein
MSKEESNQQEADRQMQIAIAAIPKAQENAQKCKEARQVFLERMWLDVANILGERTAMQARVNRGSEIPDGYRGDGSLFE